MVSISGSGVGGQSLAAGARPRRRKSLSSDGYWPWLFVFPSVLGIGTFALWPIVRTIAMSFTEAGPFGGEKWIGFDNYVQLAGDPNVRSAVLNSLEYTAIGFLGIPLALMLASILNRPGFKLVGLYRSLFFLPFMAMPVAITLVWRMIFNGNFGLVNQALAAIGIQGPYWLSTPGLLIVVIALIGVWGGLGFNILVLSAGLRSIPLEYYEAAELDGASKVRQFFSITLPLVSPTVFFLVIMQFIGGFQVFTALYVMMGPDNPQMASSQTLVYLFYNQGFTLHNVGYAAAVAVLILVIIGTVTAIQFALQKKWVFR